MIGRTNTGGGGGGLSPNSAVIHVTAPVGSTISFAKGGVVAKVLGPEKSHVNFDSPTVADWYYSVNSSNYGTWTVTATRSTDTGSKTIIIDAAYEYNLAISYHVPIDIYQEVEYIESTGGTNANAKQYINVNHTTSGYIRIKSKFAWIAGNVYFAKQEISSGVPLGFNQDNSYFMSQIAGIHDNIYVVYTSQEAVPGVVHELDFNARANNPYVSIDGNVVLEYASGLVSYMNIPIYIFAANANGNPNWYGNYRLYDWTMYDVNGNIIREFYPCYRRADSVAGLYDKENNVFYTNSGTGTFIVGADV